MLSFSEKVVYTYYSTNAVSWDKKLAPLAPFVSHNTHTHTHTHTQYYRIAGNVRGKKLWQIEIFMGKTFADCLLLPHQRTSRPKFHGETFANSHKTVKFAKVFSIESFPLYARASDQSQFLPLNRSDPGHKCFYKYEK